MKKLKLLCVVCIGIGLSLLIEAHSKSACQAMTTKAPVKNSVPISVNKVIEASEKKKNWLGTDFYFIYQFSQKPALGTSILKIQIFDKSGNKNAKFRVVGEVDMPSMRGMHSSGGKIFSNNNQNDYLLPVDIVMRGEWEICLVFYQGKSEYARARIKLDI